ncbi:MAG: DNA recombination protein RmuC [Patescibacteria group bacterium]|nr:MAG: DNA recombination protein RmuC [Patescibacteria group bacterium]
MSISPLIIFFLILGFLVIVALLVFLVINLRKPRNQGEMSAMMERLASLNDHNKEMRQLLDQKLSETHLAHHRQFSETVKIVGQVTEKLTQLDETNKQVINFSSQLQSLQDILKNPKQRGVLGEYYLETLLKNVMPPGSYQMQYSFSDGTIVDAAVFVKEKIIPIDSKFSLENYNRLAESPPGGERDRLEKVFLNDLKSRIIETSKYIQPQNKTTDFAFMFIPHEAIYYDLLINKIGGKGEENDNLIQRAAGTYKVIIVSPTSFLAYLQTVLQGLRALQIEESALAIRGNVEKLHKHILVYEDYLQKMGNSLNTTVNHYNNAYKEFKKVDKDVVKITEQESTVEPLIVDKANLEE